MKTLHIVSVEKSSTPLKHVILFTDGKNENKAGLTLNQLIAQLKIQDRSGGEGGDGPRLAGAGARLEQDRAGRQVRGDVEGGQCAHAVPVMLSMAGPQTFGARPGRSVPGPATGSSRTAKGALLPWTSCHHASSCSPGITPPLRIVVGYAPGGATDRVARIVGDKLQARLGVPVVNIGSRQMGRDRGINVVDVGYDRAEIRAGICRHLSNGRYPMDPLYGDGHAGERIAEVLTTLSPR